MITQWSIRFTYFSSPKSSSIHSHFIKWSNLLDSPWLFYPHSMLSILRIPKITLQLPPIDWSPSISFFEKIVIVLRNDKITTHFCEYFEKILTTFNLTFLFLFSLSFRISHSSNPNEQQRETKAKRMEQNQKATNEISYDYSYFISCYHWSRFPCPRYSPLPNWNHRPLYS